MIRLAVALLLLAGGFGQAPSRAVPLVDRMPLPQGYASEQDTESDGAFDFSMASGVRGHILRRFIQAGDDKTGVSDLIAFFAAEIRRQGGAVFGDRFNTIAGRLDGRIPGDHPLWLHIDVSDEGGVIDVVLVDERQPVSRQMPVEERAVPGTWESEIPIGDTIAPVFQPYRGWAWHLTADGSTRARLVGFSRSQACATCPIVTDTAPITVATFEIGPTGPLNPDIPSRRNAGELSLYQNQLIEKLLAIRLRNQVK